MEYLGEIIPVLLKATLKTIGYFGITLVLSLPIGWLLSLVRVSKKHRIAAKIVEIYTWVFRGTPLLLQLIFFYYALPFAPLPISLSREAAACIAFVINYAAYFVEIFRGGIESIGPGQYEAADVLGMNRLQTMMRIILPQAVKRVMPSIGNEVITLVKDTSLLYVLGIAELLRTTQQIITRDFSMLPLIPAAVIYLLMSWVCTRLQAKLEKRFAYYH